jgi:hypothetical protein
MRACGRRTPTAHGTGPEFEPLDAGAFDGDRYLQITADYAKVAPDDVLIRIPTRNAGQSQPNSTSYQRSGSATDGPGIAPFLNLSFVTCPTRRARWSSPRTKSLAHGSSSPALILQAVRPRFSFATTRRTSRRSLAAPRQHLIPRMASTTMTSVVRPRSIPNDAERRWPVGTASRSEPERRPRSGSARPRPTRQDDRLSIGVELCPSIGVQD